MDEIRANSNNKSIIDEQIKDTLLPEEKEYANVITNSSKGIITSDDANEFVKVLHTYSFYGKESALNEFKNLGQYLIDKNGAIKALSQISFLLGVMNSNQIIDQAEMEKMSKDYQAKIMKLLMNKN